MNTETTRRALLTAVLGAGIGGMTLTEARSYLDRFAPGSGSVWGAAESGADGTVESPYGPATVRYDDDHVPHIEADSEAAAYFAVGYCHGADRLFQMDLYRRLMEGRLAAVFGDRAVDSDVFHRQLDFAAAAEATWERTKGSETGDMVEAYVEGVNAAREQETKPLEYRLLSYEQEAWTPAASLVISKQISWGLTGSFRTLRKALARERLGQETTETLYPRLMGHDTPIIRGGEPPESTRHEDAAVPDPGMLSWLAEFETEPGIGSNSWVVSGEHTDSGDPIVANDPHLNLTVPPVWYEQHVVGPDPLDVRGVCFPGVPFVIIGQNHAGAWGFTNTGADVVDFYTYDSPTGDAYDYGDEKRQFQSRTETVAVADGEDREVTVKRSVHGAVLSQFPDGDDLRVADELGVAWTGLSATRTVDAVRQLNLADGLEEAKAAIRLFDEPTQNFVYADRDGNTYYWVTGQIPIRTTDGEVVQGTRVFDGSAKEGEWGDGYTPYGESSWDGFVPFDEKPGVENPDYLATANQRLTNDPEHYISAGYAPPFRGARIYDLLDERAASDQPMDAEFLREVQLDTQDPRFTLFRPVLEAAAETDDSPTTDLPYDPFETVLDWDGEMRPDSVGALVFERWLRAYREQVFEGRFADAGLPEDFGKPNDWVLGTLATGGDWFEEGPDPVTHAIDAMDEATAEIADEGWEDYGDWNRVRFTHPFDQDFLNYDELRTAGSPGTVRNFHSEGSTGASWRMVATFDGGSQAVLPGGNSGDYFSDSYADQLADWANGRYKPMDRSLPDGTDLRFEEVSR
ncbi:penicillin acylase family protein [Haloarchaeobius amylolyticus]|uniref:penicillin acylase family protein n=1 Tax=Haloarchaeobius amylolyticus TaxID=1198296 RepID=UPI00226EE6DD|nr:penicillin acylase family protein [Haloarchaeobius amylolyticus]